MFFIYWYFVNFGMPFIDESYPRAERDGLRLGVEIETLLSSRHAPEHTIEMDLGTFADMVCETCSSCNDTTSLEMSTDIGKPWKVTRHAGWLLTSDKTIRGQGGTTCELILL